MGAQPGLRTALPTIADVAERAKVSKTTVSHVLSGNRPVSTSTRRRVERVIAELGFTPSSVARSLVSNRSQTVALVVPDLTNPFYPAVARGLGMSLLDTEYLTFVADSGSRADQERRLLDNAIRRRVDGLVIAAFSLHLEDLVDIVTAGIPVVAIGTRLLGGGVDVVSADDRSVAVDACNYLFRKGHRRVATISGNPSSTVGQRRLEGYLASVGEHAPELTPMIETGDWTKESGYLAMLGLLQREERPTGVFAANDLMAIGALDAIRSLGLRCPDDVAVVGVDDIDAASLVLPRLTTVKLPAIDIGQAAGRLLLQRIDGSLTGPHRTVLIGHELIARESA